MRVDFRDATRLLGGINDVPSASYSMAWSDVDGDGRPDLYIGNHGDQPPLLFLSEGRGRYQTVAAPDTGKDAHTAVWADFDGDGSPELVQRVGGGAGDGLSSRRHRAISSTSRMAASSWRTARTALRRGSRVTLAGGA